MAQEPEHWENSDVHLYGLYCPHEGCDTQVVGGWHRSKERAMASAKAALARHIRLTHRKVT